MQLPEKFITSLAGIKGFDKEAFEKVHQSQEQTTSIRFNPNKALSIVNGEWPISPIHHSAFTIAQKVPWSTHGYYLSERPSFTFDPLFHAGAYYVQEASSMFLEEALKQTTDLSKPLRVLDLCAAPGGKSTLIQSLISAESLLVSNEVIKTRVNILTENITKWGSSNVIVTNNDPKDFERLENYFDVIVIDAPCSGSGLFRREPEAIEEWSEANVALCSQRQQRIISDVWTSLKENGILIYSTCSYSKQEDEYILDWIFETLNARSLKLNANNEWNITETTSDKHGCYGYRFFPDKTKGEGFFIAAFRKNTGSDFIFPKSKKNVFEKLSRREETIVKQWLKNESSYILLKKENSVYALPVYHANDFHFIHSSLYIKKAGILIGKLVHDELVPEHELAMSAIISKEVQFVDLSEEDAINYLSKEEFNINTAIKSWTLARYNKHNLGWIKVLQNRMNNYYPSSWRILKRK